MASVHFFVELRFALQVILQDSDNPNHMEFKQSFSSNLHIHQIIINLHTCCRLRFYHRITVFRLIEVGGGNLRGISIAHISWIRRLHFSITPLATGMILPGEECGCIMLHGIILTSPLQSKWPHKLVLLVEAIIMA